MKRLVQSDPLFFLLFVISYGASILLSYYVLSWNSQSREFACNAASRGYQNTYEVLFDYDRQEYKRIDWLSDLPEITDGILLTNSNCALEGSIVEQFEIRVILHSHEEIAGNRMRRYRNAKTDGYPRAIIGCYFDSYIKQEGNYYFLDLNGQRFAIEGVMAPIGLKSDDNIIWIYAEDLDMEKVDQLCGPALPNLSWVSNKKLGDESKKQIETFLIDRFGEDNVCEIEYDDGCESSVFQYAMISKLYLVPAILMLCAAAFYGVILGIIFGKRHRYEWTVRRVYGEREGHLFLTIIGQMYFYWCVAIFAAMVLIVMYYLIFGKEFLKIFVVIGDGFGIFVIGMLLSLLVSSLIPYGLSRKASAAKELRDME